MRTFVRNWDWETEEALFRSAEKVGPQKGWALASMVRVRLTLTLTLWHVLCEVGVRTWSGEALFRLAKDGGPETRLCSSVA